jgi:hypothetical protein
MFNNRVNPYDETVDPYNRGQYGDHELAMQIPSRGSLATGAPSLIPRTVSPPSAPTAYQAGDSRFIPKTDVPRSLYEGGGQSPQLTTAAFPTEHSFTSSGIDPGPDSGYSQSGGIFNMQGDVFQRYMEDALKKLEAEEKEGKGYEMPYYEAGGKGLDAYMASLGLGPTGGQGVQSSLDTFRQTPGYQFALKQAQEAGQRGLAAAGMTGSGAAAAELQKRAQGAAEGEYGGYQKQLAQLAGMGHESAGALERLGLGYGSDIASTYSALGKGEMEKKLAEEQIEAQENSAIFGALGKLGGAILGGPGGIISKL